MPPEGQCLGAVFQLRVLTLFHLRVIFLQPPEGECLGAKYHLRVMIYLFHLRVTILFHLRVMIEFLLRELT